MIVQFVFTIMKFHYFSFWHSRIHGCFLFFLFLAALGLHCCPWAFSSCHEQGLLFVAVRKLLIAVASPFAEHRL